MYLESSIVVDRSLPDVWDFFADPSNLAKWDRSVERVVVTGFTPQVGSTVRDIRTRPGTVRDFGAPIE